MNWQDVIVWFGQFILIEISKKFPKVGDWVKNNAPAVLTMITLVITVLEKILGVTVVQAAGIDSTAVNVPTHPSASFLDAVAVNFVGTVIVDNVVKKIFWRYVILKLLGFGKK